MVEHNHARLGMCHEQVWQAAPDSAAVINKIIKFSANQRECYNCK